MFLDTLFGNNITRKVQKKNRVDGQVEVLKKQQKVQYASICDDVDIRKKDIENALYNLKAYAQNEYNSDYWRTFYNLLQVI